jgi:ribosomal protein L3 glutamine methyltransferase
MRARLPAWTTLLDRSRGPGEMRGQTVRDLVRLGETMFRRAGLSGGDSHGSPRADARAAVFHVLSIVDHDDGYLDARVTDVEVEAILGLFEARLHDRVPVPWLTGIAFHAGRRFVVGPGVFVPRGQLHRVLPDVLVGVPVGGRVLELGTGCGALGILTALTRPDLSVDVTDISVAATEAAASNVRRFGVELRVRVRVGDLYQAAEGNYDLIVSHPPYIPLGASVSPGAEPADALFGGEDGLDLVRRIVVGAADHRRRGGRVVLELGADHERSGRIRGVAWLPVDGRSAGICVVESPADIVFVGDPLGSSDGFDRVADGSSAALRGG